MRTAISIVPSNKQSLNPSCLSISVSLCVYSLLLLIIIILLPLLLAPRHAELEREQAAGKAAGEAEEPPKPFLDVSIGGSAEAKRVKRLEREMRCLPPAHCCSLLLTAPCWCRLR
jgi:hypothetical protein